MKLIPLTKGEVAVVNDRDFEWLSEHRWHAFDSGTTCYASRNEWDGEKWAHVMMHREVALRAGIIGEFDRADHKDTNGLNNQRGNLRKATISQNQMNKRKSKNKTSRFKGVSWKSFNQKWVAQIACNGKRMHIGLFNKEKDAAKAYDRTARNLFAEFSRPNFRS